MNKETKITSEEERHTFNYNEIAYQMLIGHVLNKTKITERI